MYSCKSREKTPAPNCYCFNSDHWVCIFIVIQLSTQAAHLHTCISSIPLLLTAGPVFLSDSTVKWSRCGQNSVVVYFISLVQYSIVLRS